MVISEETQKNGSKVNVKRVENNLPELDVHIVKVIKVDPLILAQNPGDEDKLSSSNERRKLLGTLLKPPHVKYKFIFVSVDIVVKLLIVNFKILKDSV